MGGALSAPVELIRVQRHGSGAFRCGVAEMQGWRSSHEDAHEVKCNDTMGAFWVLDGHGGDGAALFGAPQVGKEFTEVIGKGEIPENARIEEGLIAVDAAVRSNNTDSGSTIVGAMARKEADGTYSVKMINAGDSRGIVVRSHTEQEASAKSCPQVQPPHLLELMKDPEAVKKGDAPSPCEWPLIQESIDHKPSHPTEKARIEAAGGHVTDDEPPRLDGNLAVSRGLGDFEYKASTTLKPGNQKVSCVPDIYEVKGLVEGSIVVLCCDGVYDVLTSSDVANFVHGLLREDPERDLGEIAAKIIKESLDKNSRDNITAMVVQLSSGKIWQESQPPDEMKGFEKLVAGHEDQVSDDEVRGKYISFLKRSQFPTEPIFCDVCAKWYQSTSQCPCRKVVYCSKLCQKKGWKKHKPICEAVKK